MPDLSIRLFAAVPLPDGLKQSVADWRGRFDKKLPFRKWVNPADLHITLQFLGSTPERRMPDIRQALEEAADGFAPFELTVGPLGIFGRPGSPSILWAGIGGETEALGSLQRRTAGALAPLGFKPDERPFHPHLTLARNYVGKEPLIKEKLAEFGAPGEGGPLRWTAADIALYVSHLDRKPPLPMYEAAATLPLRQQRA